jgi:hypothetical protein
VPGALINEGDVERHKSKDVRQQRTKGGGKYSQNLAEVDGEYLKVQTVPFLAIWSAGTPRELREGLGEQAGLALFELQRESSFGRGMSVERKRERLAEVLGVPRAHIDRLFGWWMERGVLIPSGGGGEGLRLASSLEDLEGELQEDVVRRLGLLADGPVSWARGSARSWIPVPRRMVAELCKQRRARGKVATVVAHCHAHLFQRGRKTFNPRGLCSSAWVSDVFDVCSRTVHRARHWLVESLAWLKRLGGTRFEIVCAWARAALPQEAPGSPQVSGSPAEEPHKCQPQYQRTSSSKKSNQRASSGRLQADLGDIRAERLRDDDYVWELGKQAIAKGWLPNNLNGWMNLFTTVREVCRARTARNRGKVLWWRIKNGRWFGTEADQARVEPMVRERLGLTKESPEEREASSGTALFGGAGGASSKPKLSDDGRVLSALEQRMHAGRLPGVTVIDLPDVMREHAQWTLERFQRAWREVQKLRMGEVAWS